MKRIIFSMAAIAAIMFFALLLGAEAAYPMHLGEPSYYHAARVECLVGATVCGLASIVASIVASNI